jgi:hypothetical protein
LIITRVTATGINPAGNYKTIGPVRTPAEQFFNRLADFRPAPRIFRRNPDDFVIVRVLVRAELVA